jgi:hypothetical protein
MRCEHCGRKFKKKASRVDRCAFKCPHTSRKGKICGKNTKE